MHKKIFALILLDQVTKLIFWPARLASGEAGAGGSRDFYFGFFHIHPVKNFGLGFSLNFGLLTNLAAIAFALLFFVYYYFAHRQELSWAGQIAFVLILAGAVSNIADRLYLGYVRDFLDIGLGFTFNLADGMVVAGLIIILLHQAKTSPMDKI